MLYCGAACIRRVIHHRATLVMGGLQCERGSHFSETTWRGEISYTSGQVCQSCDMMLSREKQTREAGYGGKS